MNIVVLLEYESMPLAALKVTCVFGIFVTLIVYDSNYRVPVQMQPSIISLVVKYLPSKQMSWVRFPDDASF